MLFLRVWTSGIALSIVSLLRGAILWVFLLLAEEHAALPHPCCTRALQCAVAGWQLGLATDLRNEGRAQRWFQAPRTNAVATTVPWIIQDAFPGYHGVAWYWREFEAPTNPHAGGRYLLRFWAVDYLADVWLNGVRVGGHEGGETPFVLDVTDASSRREESACRAGVESDARAHRWDRAERNAQASPGDPLQRRRGLQPRRHHGFGRIARRPAGAHRGSVRPGRYRRRASSGSRPTCATPARGPRAGKWSSPSLRPPPAKHCSAGVVEREFPPGDTLVAAELKLEQPRLWELNDPFLYRVTARVTTAEPGSVDELSVRCGFRDFVSRTATSA